MQPTAFAYSAMNETALTVSELSNAIKNVVEGSFELVRVQGEISGMKKAASGHCYFSLKDNDAVINAIAWKGTKLPPETADGLEVICTGKVTTFPGNSRYQIVINSMETAGIGTLLKLLEELKQKLAKEGLFDKEYKKPIPFLPQTIGVITSPTGAVIRDIMHRVSDRFPVHILLYPVLVQGEGAAKQIAEAINNFNISDKITRPDVIIVARGGGSLEDLWCFNDEQVVRAAFKSEIPIISAVGHETDTTLIDFVSDLRAPTPTGAAEKAVPVRSDLISTLSNNHVRLYHALTKKMEMTEQRLIIAYKGLPDLSSVINTFWQKLDFNMEKLEQKMQILMTQLSSRLELVARILESCSYKNILEKGFALIRDSAKNPVTSAKKLPADANVEIQFHDGSIKALLKWEGVKSKKKNKDPPNQGSLF